MKSIPHPSSFIDSTLADALRRHTAEAEQLRSLHPGQLAVIYKNRWFNLYVPIAYGGLAASLPAGLRTQEALAWADGSVGWTVTLCSGANWFVGFLQQEIAGKLFKPQEVCLAGSDRPSGIAGILNDGTYEISGSWRYATGSVHATAFTANCHMEKDGQLLLNEDGTPQVATFIFLSNEVEIHDDWKGMGMIATSSNSFKVSRLKVDKNRRFQIEAGKAVLPGKIYRYPFLQLAESTLSVNMSGMAIHFMDLLEAQLRERSLSAQFTPERRHFLLLRCGAARHRHQHARERFYDALQTSWDQWDEQNHFVSISPESVSRVSRQLSATSREVVDELFPLCGLIAADPSSALNRVWRNLHTACLHPLLLPWNNIATPVTPTATVNNKLIDFLFKKK